MGSNEAAVEPAANRRPGSNERSSCVRASHAWRSSRMQDGGLAGEGDCPSPESLFRSGLASGKAFFILRLERRPGPPKTHRFWGRAHLRVSRMDRLGRQGRLRPFGVMPQFFSFKMARGNFIYDNGSHNFFLLKRIGW